MLLFFLFFFNDTATTEIYTLSLHDALPIWAPARPARSRSLPRSGSRSKVRLAFPRFDGEVPSHDTARSPRCTYGHPRSEEHTSELQSRQYLVCRLLLEKKKTNNNNTSKYSS